MIGKLPASAVILAGGKGERMGGSKLYLSQGGAFLIERIIEKMSALFGEVLLSVARGESGAVRGFFSPLLELYSVRLVEDRVSGEGPTEGLRAGLCAMRGEWAFLIGCDMPSPQEAVVRRIWSKTSTGSDISAARLGGRVMPLHAFYHRRCARLIDSLTEGTSRARGPSLRSIFPLANTAITEEHELSTTPCWPRSFTNHNQGAKPPGPG